MQWLLTSDGTKSAATIGDNQTTLQKNGVLQVHSIAAAVSCHKTTPVFGAALRLFASQWHYVRYSARLLCAQRAAARRCRRQIDAQRKPKV